jgi:hypothetical protein
MLKVKKITLSGFRGILKPQDLVLTVKGDSVPHSLVLYGLNSSGKTSFVDGLEWFLSEENKVEWLKRQDAEEKAYPHQAVDPKKDESFVELDFYDTDKKLATLRKTYNHKTITKPVLSSEEDFENIYKAFVIRPYLRYLEVIDFIYNHTGVEKYQKLANWMGFESELAFQEKLALKILPELKRKKEELDSNVKLLERHLTQLMISPTATGADVLRVGNEILKKTYKMDPHKDLQSLLNHIPEFAKLRATSSVGITIDKLTQAETGIELFKTSDTLPDSLTQGQTQVEEFKKEKAKLGQIDVISLYDQALGALTKQTESSVECPVCGTHWEREKLVEHIQNELDLLAKVKQDKEAIEKTITGLKSPVGLELDSVKRLISKCEDAQKIVASISYDKTKEYQTALSELESSWLANPLTGSIATPITKELVDQVVKETEEILNQISTAKTKIQPSKEDLKLAEDIEKLTQIRTKWLDVEEGRAELSFTTAQVDAFVVVSNKLIGLIQDNIKSRFNEISERIGKYFCILRNDKDIKNIEIVLNEEKGKAAGRSAEIQLHYYDVSVKPAYKVLSESLLNSLGLAVYFTCIRQFNRDCKFIVLDDIMNSLDIDKRDTLLDLIEQEFGDYQVVLFTHDLYWFQKIMRRFPNWIVKKIKNWKYETGATIDAATTTQQEIEENLADSTKIETAGWLLERHVEGLLNEFCENLSAEVRYRYTKNDPPSMEELFTALHKRLKDKIKNHPAVQQVLETKKYEPVLRNFVSHARTNSPTSVSPQEIKRAAEEWFKLEAEFWCRDCRQFVEYHPTKDSIECECGKKKLERTSTAKQPQLKAVAK